MKREIRNMDQTGTGRIGGLWLLFLLFAWDGAASAQDVVAELPNEVSQRVARELISDRGLRADVQFLADDLLEGRGPGTRGDRLAMLYVKTQFELLGLQPAAPEGGWVQPVPLVGVTTRPPDHVRFDGEGGSIELKNSRDYIMTSGLPRERSRLDDAQLVFVGYGIQAPEYQWDDFKDVDVRGKILVVMNNDPADDPQLFQGRTRLYYGRWDYKYAKAAELGAAGMLIIHTTESAGYPWQVVQTSWTGPQMALAGHEQGRLPMEGWVTEDAARKLFQLGGQDLDALRAAAESRDFRPVPLGIRTSFELKCLVEPSQTGNVLGLLPGSDPELRDEWVVFMAHHDHLGMGQQRDDTSDFIYNGAVDNATGVASMLNIARAFAHLPEDLRPRRSVLFASVGAEEQGLLGSEYLAAHPPVPPGNLAAVINIDGINILGPTRDVVVVGKGKSDLDQIVERMARHQNRVVLPDQFPDRGYYYRSDQFSLAKIGVPGVYLSSGVHVIGKPDGWGREKLREWTENIYHQPSDEYRDDWNLEGAVMDAQLLFHVGLQVALQTELPAWVSGDEFESARKRALTERESGSRKDP